MDGAVYGGEAAVSAGEATFERTFHVSGVHKISLQVYADGSWRDSGAGAKALTVRKAPRLGTPGMTNPSGGTLYVLRAKGAVLEWKAVKKAARYAVSATNAGGACVWGG